MPGEADNPQAGTSPAGWTPRDDLMPPESGTDSDGQMKPANTAPAQLTDAAPAAPPEAKCPSCQSPVKTSARFCSHCGRDLKPALARIEERRRIHRQEQDWAHVRGVVWFYFIYLGSVIPLIWLPDDITATAMLVIGGIDAFIIMGWWGLTRMGLIPQLLPQRSIVRPLLIGCALLLILLPLNLGYHGLLRWWFALDPSKVPSLTAPFDAEGYGLGIQLFAIALMPAIWEEIAFRGLIQERLRGVVGTREAIGLTAALFAIIHVSWLSLPYLFLLGLILGVLRQRSGSLLPGMALHGLHNAAVVLL